MEVMIFLALVYIAYHMPTESQACEIIRLLKDAKLNDPVQSKTDDTPTVDRRKR